MEKKKMKLSKEKKGGFCKAKNDLISRFPADWKFFVLEKERKKKSRSKLYRRYYYPVNRRRRFRIFFCLCMHVLGDVKSCKGGSSYHCELTKRLTLK